MMKKIIVIMLITFVLSGAGVSASDRYLFVPTMNGGERSISSSIEFDTNGTPNILLSTEDPVFFLSNSDLGRSTWRAINTQRSSMTQLRARRPNEFYKASWITDLRRVTVTTPENMTDDEPVAMIMVLHGLGASFPVMEERMPIAHLIDDRRFIHVFPLGVNDPGYQNFNGALGWEAFGNEFCCKSPFHEGKIDEIAYLRSVVDGVFDRHPNIDRSRVFVLGASAGGIISYEVLSRMSDVFVAGVHVVGRSTGIRELVNPEYSVSVLDISATQDDVYPFNGGLLSNTPGLQMPGVMKSLEIWVDELELEPLADTGVRYDLDSDVPGMETEVWAPGGIQNKTKTVEHWRIVNGQHRPGFRDDSGEPTSVSEKIVDWLYSHARE